MQITGNHQRARIVRHNDESVREGYIRNGGKEVKLFTSALRTFQCNYRIVMAQRKHLDDFLRGRIIRRLEYGRKLKVSEELGIAPSVISRLWQRFQDDGNVSKCYSTGRPELQRRIRTSIWQLLPKETDGEQHQTCLVSSLQLPVRQFHKADRVQTLRAHWSIISLSLQSASRRTLIWRAPGTRYYQENTIGRHRYRGTGWLVWGGIILGSGTDLHV
ncbi:uncharacterized protein TNCV_2411191 [Trichonephila clavipes]|nr:uncharacterized protein TNCV_2411191 [Trichonephila clavipes]